VSRGGQRSAVLAVLGVAVIAALALAGYALGRGSRTTNAHVRAARAKAEAAAFRAAEIEARARARTRGYHDGYLLGQRLATEALRRAGAGPRQTSVGQPAPPGGCSKGQYTTPSGVCALIPASFSGSPPANSPEGKKMIKQPPSYAGPVQC
jgi:hypothetical protein